MKEFKDYLKVILLHEGGYTNDSADPGKETYKGISRVFEANWKGWEIVDRYKKLDNFPLNLEKDTELPELVAEVYLNKYYTPMNLGLLNNELLRLHLFDMGVNAGTKTAIKLLQQIVSTKEDGILGKITASSANNISNIVDLYKLKRIAYYNNLVLKNNKLKKFLNGWINRVNLTNFK